MTVNVKRGLDLCFAPGPVRRDEDCGHVLKCPVGPHHCVDDVAAYGRLGLDGDGRQQHVAIRFVGCRDQQPDQADRL